MLSAVETLEWLVKHETRLDEIFGFQISSWTLNLSYILNHYTPQEIVDRIEEYKTKKKKQEFKPGDIIKNTKLSIVSSFKEYVNEDYVRTSGNDVWNIENVVKIERPTWSEYECAHRYDKPKEENEVDKTSDVYHFAEWCYVNGINFGFMSTNENPTPKRLQEIISRYESEIGKPKEEKQKIKKALGFWGGFDEKIANNAIITLNQLVDAVNELRGVYNED